MTNMLITVERLARLHDGTVFLVDRPKTDWYARSTSYMSRIIFNNLPAHVRSINDQDSFRRAVKRHFCSVRQENIDEQGNVDYGNGGRGIPGREAYS